MPVSNEAFTYERTPDTIPTKSRKGRTSFRVISAHVVHRYGADPFREDDIDESGRTNLYRFDGPTLASMADVWCRQHGHDLPAIVGLEQGRLWQQITHTDGDSDETGPLARHRCGIDGGWNLPMMADVVGSAARSDHKYRPSHSLSLGWHLRDALSDALPTAGTVKAWPVRGAGKGRAWLSVRKPRNADPIDPVTGRPNYGDALARRVTVKRWEIRDTAGPVRPGDAPLGRLVEVRYGRTAVRSIPTETCFVGHRAVRRTSTVASARTEVRASTAVRAAAASDAAAGKRDRLGSAGSV